MRRPADSLYCSAASIAFVLGVGIYLLISTSDGRATQASDGQNDRPSLIMAPNREFAASSYVHKQLSPDAPRDRRSAIWVADLLRQIKTHYGVASVNIHQYTPPLYVVPRDEPTVHVGAKRQSDPSWTFRPLQLQWASVPLPDNFQPSAGTDKEAIVYQPSTREYWEFWGLQRSDRKVVDSAGRTVDEWQAAWGGKIDDLATNPGYFPTTPQGYKFGTAATGLALLAGLMTVAEQRRGVIDHAIHIGLPETRRSVWTYPAQRTDGQDNDANAIPEGTTFRLPADLDLDAIDMDSYARMIARAVQKYGMVVRDTAGTVVLYAENPVVRGAADPYFGPGGILRCAHGYLEAKCYPDGNNRLRGFPWNKLVALRAKLEK